MHAFCFEEVVRLPASEQRRLLDDGDAPERLWAAWAIALELGSKAVPMLTSAERSDISDGLRRQLLVVLAGLGERQLVRTIADADASPSVQATATSLYLRTAPDPTSLDTITFAVDQLKTPAPDVRLAVLNELRLGRVAIPLTELLCSLRDPTIDVRHACLACLTAIPSLLQKNESTRALIESFAHEEDTRLRRLLVAALPRARVRDLLETVFQHHPSKLADAIQVAHAHFGALSWLEVQPVARSSKLDDLRAILRAEVRPEPPGGLAWLCETLRLVNGNDEWFARDLRWRSLALIQNLLTPESAASLDMGSKQMLRAIFSKTLAELREYVDEYGPESTEDEIAEIERVLEVLH